MKISLGRMVLLVKDYDEALTFYEKIFDSRVLFDKTNEEGKRFVHIGFDKKSRVGIWLLEAETEEEKSRIGNQTGGKTAMVMYCDDFDKMHRRLKDNMVNITMDPVEAPGVRFLHFKDLYGNEIILMEQQEEE
jgi:predicted enzyme related to lactoylglutathione lyase